MIGDRTDIGHWWEWFRGSDRDAVMAALYAETEQNCGYTRMDPAPAGANQIVMFKSCFPNSNLGGNPNDPPTTGSNPLRGQDAYSEHHTVANAKGIYNDILNYFAAHQEKLFVVIAAPPLRDEDTSPEAAANARAFNNWLVNDWLDGYPYHNVFVFDFYNVLTSNGGNADTNDLGRATGNHHRYRNGAIEHITSQGVEHLRRTRAATATPPPPATRRPRASTCRCSTSPTTAGRGSGAAPGRPPPARSRATPRCPPARRSVRR